MSHTRVRKFRQFESSLCETLEGRAAFILHITLERAHNSLLTWCATRNNSDWRREKRIVFQGRRRLKTGLLCQAFLSPSLPPPPRKA